MFALNILDHYKLVCRVVESANPYFILQKRKGRGSGLAGLLVGTIDSVLDYKVSLECCSEYQAQFKKQLLTTHPK